MKQDWLKVDCIIDTGLLCFSVYFCVCLKISTIKYILMGALELLGEYDVAVSPPAPWIYSWEFFILF